jgi:AAHS family 3-hydroxyphenylpropionic acid transporter
MMFSAGLFGLLPSAFIGGWLADHYGRRRILVASVVIFGVFSLATAYVGDYQSLLIVRFLAGIGLGAAMPVLIAMSSDAAGFESSSRAVSITYAGLPLGGVFAALVGSMGQAEDWRNLFYVGGVLPILIAVFLWKLLPNASRPQSVQSNVPRAGVLSLFQDGLWRRTFTMWIAGFFVLTVLYMLLNWLPSLLAGKGYSRPQSGAVQMLFNIGGAAGSLVVGQLMATRFRRTAVTAIYFCMLISLAGIGLFQFFPLILASGFLAGFSAIGCQLVLYAIAPTMYAESARATGVGAAITAGRFGAVLGPFVTGNVLAAGLGVAGVMAASAPGILIAAAAALSLLRPIKKSN